MRLLGILSVLAAAALGADEGAACETAATSPPGTRGRDADTPLLDVRTSVVTLTDPSRATPATSGAGHRPGRVIPTHLYEPVGPGPFPLILFAHGLDGHPRKFTRLLTAWAAAGHVVAVPTFPVSNDEAPGGADFVDLHEQPDDMAFVLDRLLAADSPLEATVDPARIGAGGLSLGGATVYGFVYDESYRDDRVGAAMVLDANELGFAPELTRGPPLLLIHADPDPTLPYENSAAHYASASVPAAFLTLHETAHAEPYEDVTDPADDVVERVTVAWWQLWLDKSGGGGHGPLDRIDAAVADAAELTTWACRLG